MATVPKASQKRFIEGSPRSRKATEPVKDRRTKEELLAAMEILKVEAEAAQLKVLAAERRVAGFRQRANDMAVSRSALRVRVRELERPLSKSPFERMVNSIVETLPVELAPVVKGIALDPSMNETIRRVMERERDYPSSQRALLAGLAMDRRARTALDVEMNLLTTRSAAFKRMRMPPGIRELVVGGGIHAAIYSAVRVARGFQKPVVIDKGPRLGGVFANSVQPAFYLNSSNRPGDLSIPGAAGALNVLPGAPLQPSDISGDEYQSNDTLGFLARLSLAMHAETAFDEVNSIVASSRGITVRFLGADPVQVSRVIIATGLGIPKTVRIPSPSGRKSDRILNFEEFTRRMDSPFPMEGMKRVAVIGAGDSGKTVIEALAGQGPPLMSAAALDWPQVIDWYGVPEDRFYREGWERCSRSRYRQIARLLPSEGGSRRVLSRVTPIQSKASRVTPGFNCVFVNDTPYDYVINCTGYFEGPTVDREGTSVSAIIDGMIVGVKTGQNVYTIGPAANIPVSEEEQVILRRIAENKTALFRYAPRTAALAAALPE